VKNELKQLQLPFHTAHKVIGGFKALLEERPASISMAIRPMESFYTYQAVALANSLAYLQANRDARLMVVQADLEFDMQRGSSFIPYSRNPEAVLTSHRIAELLRASPALDPSFQGRISVRRFSEWLSQDPGLFDHVLRLFDKAKAREAKQLISKKTGKVSHLPVAPICPSCDHASASFGVINPNGSRLESICHHNGCTNFGHTFSVDVRVPGTFCMFYFFDSVADGYNDPAFGRTDLHMMGIDPTKRWVNGMEVFEVISRLTALLAEDGYSPKYCPTMRLEEACSMKRKSVFEKFHQERGITETEALCRLMNIAAGFDGQHHLTMADLDKTLPIVKP
jgi:hypothetical protein